MKQKKINITTTHVHNYVCEYSRVCALLIEVLEKPWNLILDFKGT